MNDDERRLWVNNSEGLYRWRQETGLAMTTFIRKFRAEIDAYIKELEKPRR